jgi:drug/metabolite transporter (DMT)-like permease
VFPILLAALSAVSWGTGDFCGGKAARRSNALAVTVLSQVAGLPLLAASVAVIGGSPTVAALGWGAVAGIAGFLGLLLLYGGLAAGSMIVFAPISAATSAILPLGVGLALGERPGALPLIGACCAIVAIALVSASAPAGGSGGRRTGLRQVGLAVLSGLMFGIFISLVAKAGDGSGLWPIVGVRVGSVGLGALALARTRTTVLLPRPALRWALLAGPFDVLANMLYRLAAEHGMLSIVAPVGSLYPASTVLLALLVDRERIRPVQAAGLGLAATALILVAT